MSKELIKPSQFAHADVLSDELLLQITPEQQEQLKSLYESLGDQFKSGKLLTGTIKSLDSGSVLVDIGYKSDGFIPRFEFGEHEFKNLKVGDSIEVMLDELENIEGNVSLSYEKAKAIKAWDRITKLFEGEQPVEGIVTHKVKGGLNVDVGIPAFLPGSQIDVQRITDFDQFVGQTITAYILKLNKKRGNVIISRRKYLSDIRSESRKKVLDTISEGQVIQGIVKNITNYGAFIDIGGVDGLLHITDMTWGRINHPSELIKIGQTVPVKVLSFDKEHEKISLGMKQLTENPWEQVAQELKVGSKVKGKISSITDYGLFVEVLKGAEGLVHISEVSWSDRVNNLASKFKVGQEVEVLIVSIDPVNRRMSLSIKQLEKNPWESIKEQFKVGQKIKGRITNITDFGIFVQLVPGVDGLVHISDFSWTEHINHPSDLYKKGDEVEAAILSIEPENKKISLGIKQLAEDPWQNIKEHYPVGSIVDGEVSKITNFGAFIKLPIGIEGLIHISELDKAVDKVEDALKVGQPVKARVINANQEDRKLGLSLKLEAAPKAEARVERPKKERPVQAEVQQKPAVKQKSSLQLALEEHAARKDDKE